MFRADPPDQYRFQPELRLVLSRLSPVAAAALEARDLGADAVAAIAVPFSSVDGGAGRGGAGPIVSAICGIGLLIVLLKALLNILLDELLLVWSLGLRLRAGGCW
jgi:hypothetical protein